jgi:serine/threonine protein kinase/WD40 repeat protein
MNEPFSTPNAADEFLAPFLRAFNETTDRDAFMQRFAHEHPEWADEFRDLAGMNQRLADAGAVSAVEEEAMPAQLGQFRILRLIARGGMGEIYEAIQEPLGRHVAVKVIRRGRATPEAQARFARERKVLALLHQTHVVPIFAAGEAESLHYFAMPFIQGANLSYAVAAVRTLETLFPDNETPTLAELAREWVKNNSKESAPTARVTENDHPSKAAGPPTNIPTAEKTGAPESERREAKQALLPPANLRLSKGYLRSVAQTLAAAAEAAHHAHEAGIIHRDIKPSNVMVEQNGQTWLIDFGLGGPAVRKPDTAGPALDFDWARETVSLNGQIKGTPQYMAPEQYDNKADERSDVWALGVTLYELLTLRQAFAGESVAAIKNNVLNDEPSPPQALVHDVPRDLDAICMKALEKNPNDRYASARDLAEDLRRWQRGEPTQAWPGGPFHWLWLWSLRNKKLAALSFLLLLAALLSAGFGWAMHDAKLKANVATEKLILEADSHAKSKVWSLIELARNRLQVPAEGRRWETQKILRDIGEFRRKIVPDETTERMDLEIRSLYARTLGVLDLKPLEEEDRLTLKGDPFQDWPAAMHPDGEAMAVGLPGRPLYWARGKKPAVPTDLDAKKPRPRLVYSPDGNYLAFYPQEGGLQIWDREATRIVRDLLPAKTENRVLDVGFDAAVKTLWACCADGRVLSWSLPDFQNGAARPLGDKPAGGFTAARFNKDASLLAVGDATGRVFLYDSGGKLHTTLPARGAREVESLAWSPDDQLVAVGTHDGTIHLWQRDGTLLYDLAAFSIGVERLHFSPDSRWLLAGERHEGMKVWDATRGELAVAGDDPIWAFARDGRRFAGGNFDEVAFRELVEPLVLRQFRGHRRIVEHLAWSRNNRNFVTIDTGFEIRVWDVTRPIPLIAVFRVTPSDFWAPQAAVALSDDGSQVAYASGGSSSAVVLVLDTTSGKQLARWNLPGGFEQLVAAGPNKFLSVREEHRGGKVTLDTVARELTVGKPLPEGRTLRASERGDVSGFLNAELTPNGRYYRWVGPREPAKDRRIDVFDVATGQRLTRVASANTPDFEPAAYLSADGHHLWLDDGLVPDSTLHYNLTRTAAPQRVNHAPPFVVTPDLSWMAVESSASFGHSRGFYLLHAHGNRPTLELATDDFTRRIDSQSVSHDGRYLTWRSGNGTIAVVDLPALKKEIKAFENVISGK